MSVVPVPTYIPMTQLQHVSVIRPMMQQVMAQEQGNTDHEMNMINNLQHHIWNSLAEAPDDLSELKGIHARMPKPYKGKDNSDKMDNWLQGLLCHFKLHHLMGIDRDAD